MNYNWHLHWLWCVFSMFNMLKGNYIIVDTILLCNIKLFKTSLILTIFHLALPCLTCRFSYSFLFSCAILIVLDAVFLPLQGSCSCTKLQLILVAILSFLHLQLCQSHPNTWHHELSSSLFFPPKQETFYAAYFMLQKSSDLKHTFLSWFLY